MDEYPRNFIYEFSMDDEAKLVVLTHRIKNIIIMMMVISLCWLV